MHTPDSAHTGQGLPAPGGAPGKAAEAAGRAQDATGAGGRADSPAGNVAAAQSSLHRNALFGGAAFRGAAPVAATLRRLRVQLGSRPDAAEPARGRSADAAGALLARITVLPAVLIVAWLIPGVPLLLGGVFRPVPMLLISVPVAVVLIVGGLRVVPATWPTLRPASRTRPRGWTTWFGLLATVAVVAGLTAWQLTESSAALIVVRDPGTYLQAGYWIAQHGSLPVPETAKAFGGLHSGFSFASTGFLARGGGLYPAVLPGLPILLAGGFWAHGVAGAVATGPVLGGLAVLAFAGLVARLAGPQWAPAGALVLGLSLPQQYTGRTSLPETALEILLFGGLCLLADSLALRGWRQSAAGRQVAAGGAAAVGSAGDRSAAVGSAAEGASTHTAGAAAGAAAANAGAGAAAANAADDAAAASAAAEESAADATTLLSGPQGPAVWRGRVAAARQRVLTSGWLTPPQLLAVLAGLAVGFSLAVSVSAVLYLLAVIPVGCALAMGRRPQATAFLVSVAVGVLYGLLGCFLLDRPGFDLVGHTAAMGGVAAVWLAAVAIVAGQLARLGRVRRFVPRILARRPLRWLPEAGALLTVAVLVGFAIRPYVQTVRGHPDGAQYRFIASLQRLQGLPVDPTRSYAEQTLYWVIWYIGLPTVLLGGLGLALLVRRCLRALLTWRDPDAICRAWALPLTMICAGSLLVLWAPDISPDQPWASQRLVVLAIPGLILGAIWAASWLVWRARDRGARSVTAALAGLFCAAAMLVPTVFTTFGIGFSHSGKSGGLKPIAQGLATSRTGAGEISAVANLCARIPGNAAVLIVDAPTAAEFAQTIRGMCGVPVASMAGQPASAVDGVLASISSAGRRPLLLAGSAAALSPYGVSALRVLDLRTAGDAHELTQPPTAMVPVRYQLWLAAPGTSRVGT